MQNILKHAPLKVIVLSCLLCACIAVYWLLVPKPSQSENMLFAAAISLASAASLAHQQWETNGHSELDKVDNLSSFRRNNLNMTFNGWPRGLTGSTNHSMMDNLSCQEVWQALVADRWHDQFYVFVNDLNQSICKFKAKNQAGSVEYDVRRGLVRLNMLSL